MKFWASTAFSPPEHYLGMAQALEVAGFHGMTFADHLLAPRNRTTPYPYAADGRPGWSSDSPFPDVWVTIGALSAVTSTLEFASSVYVAPARDLFTVAKAVGTAALFSDNRVVFGVGAGWMAEEFALTGQPFADRGERLDEMLGVLGRLWSCEWVEHHGRHYDFGPLQMSPRPTQPVPMWAGGYSRAAIRRAWTLCDGWVGVVSDEGQGIEIVEALRRGRSGNGHSRGPFDITVSLPYPVTRQVAEQWAERGVTGLVVRPWAETLAPDLSDLESAQRATSLDRKVAAAQRFGADVIDVIGRDDVASPQRER